MVSTSQHTRELRHLDAHMTQTALLDTNVFVNRPQILSYDLPDTEYVTTPGVLADLERLQTRPGSRRPFAELVRTTLDAGKLKVVSAPPTFPLEPVMSRGRFDPTETELLTVAKYLAQAQSVMLVTDDVILIREATAVGVPATSATAFLASIPATSTQHADVAQKAATAARFTAHHLLLSAIAGVLATVGAILVVQNVERIVGTVNVWGTIVLLIGLGLALFWFRSRWRLAYGLFEYLVGVVGTVVVFFPAFDYAQLTTAQGLQVLGGLYVMVRGLDNIGKGLEGTKWAGIWSRVFG